MRADGFTLIEMMIALAIFAIVAVAGSAAVTSGIQSKEQLVAKEARLGALHVGRAIMKADFAQAVLREVRDPEDGRRLSAFTGGYETADGALINFIRAGWSNPNGLEPRGTLQLVRYRLDGTTLVRESFVRLDAMRDTPRIERPIMDGVRDIRLTYFDGAQWGDRWPISSRAGNRLPTAVAIEMEAEGLGTLRHVFLTPGGGR